MAIIPRYTSRALPLGAQPGMIDSALDRGKAGARLAAAAGDTIIAGIDFKKRKDAAKAAEQAYGTQVLQEIKGATATIGDSLESSDPEENIPDGPRGDRNTVFGGSTPAGNTSTAMAAKTGSSLFARTNLQKQVGGTLDGQSEKVSLGSFETTILGFGVEAKAALNQSGTPAKGATQRALVAFDRKVLELSKRIENRPHLKAPFDALVASVRAPLEFRLLGHENARRVDEDKLALADSLSGLAQAAVHDPAMAPGVTGRGFAQIESAMQAGMLAPEEAAAMQGAFAENVHMSAMRGQIATAPEDMQTRLVAGEFDEVFDAPARDQLLGEARVTARLKASGASAAARAKRRGLEIDMEEHLAALDATGAGDEALAARARAELPETEHAAFQASAAQARERHATRAEYAFMTSVEIEADIARRVEGGPANIDRRDGDQRAADHALRTAIRDEVLTARATDPAGWAMRDDAVAAAFTAAQENPDNPDKARHASQQRIALQREMGIEPRLLSDAERDEIAGALAEATPADRPALIADLRARYGPQYDGLVKELSGRVAPDTGVLMAHAGDPPLASALARGMAMDSVEFRGARVLTLPMIDGKLDSSRLEDKQLYQFMAGDRVVSVIYDRKADALVPALAEASGEGEGDNSGQPGRIVSAIHGAGQEAANIVAGVPKSQAFFAAEISRRTLEDMLAIQMDEEPFWVHRNHADRATLIRFRQASPEERLRMLADQASVFPQDSAFYKFGEAISEYAREALPTNPDYEDELFQKLARAGGGLGGLIFVGGMLRRAGIPPVVTVAATGATTQMVAQFEDALQGGATMEEAYDAANLGALVGLTEAVPITRLFDRLDKGTGGSIRRALIEAAKGGAEEALQETFQTIVESLIASDLVGYDPDRRIFEGLGENAGISFSLGGVVNFVAAIAGGRRSASNGQTREDSVQADEPGGNLAPEGVGDAPSENALSGIIEFELAGSGTTVPIDAENVVHPETGMTFAEARENNEKLIDERRQRPKLDKELAENVAIKLYGNGARVKERRFDIILGYPGAGKSTLAKPIQDLYGSMLMDVDNAKPHLPGYDQGLGESLVLSDASKIVFNHLAPRAREAGDNIVWPAVGGQRRNVEETIKKFQKKGYQIYIHYVDLPHDEAFKRVVDRFSEKGRFVDPDFVAGLGNSPRETFDQLVSDNPDIAGYTVFDNNVARGDASRLVEFGGPSGAGVAPEGLAELLVQWGIEQHEKQ